MHSAPAPNDTVMRAPNDETTNMGQIKMITWMVRLPLRRTAERHCDATSIRFLLTIGRACATCLRSALTFDYCICRRIFGSFIYLSIICSDGRKLAIPVPWYFAPKVHSVERYIVNCALKAVLFCSDAHSAKLSILFPRYRMSDGLFQGGICCTWNWCRHNLLWCAHSANLIIDCGKV